MLQRTKMILKAFWKTEASTETTYSAFQFMAFTYVMQETEKFFIRLQI